ncbi:hypothetical protein B0H14DRAFT_2607130 [Mycena olivaceomarginata]|nr:hypothetical protein B0H14DRAFT_2607130 [Mycena olivaceomarginata]
MDIHDVHPWTDNDRFVLIHQEKSCSLDWLAGVHAGNDYWVFADAFITAQRAGKVDVCQSAQTQFASEVLIGTQACIWGAESNERQWYKVHQALHDSSVFVIMQRSDVAMQKEEHTIDLTETPRHDGLPLDLEHIIFETAAVLHPTSIAICMLVATQVKEWYELQGFHMNQTPPEATPAGWSLYYIVSYTAPSISIAT